MRMNIISVEDVDKINFLNLMALSIDNLSKNKILAIIFF